MLTDPFKDGRKDRLEDFRYGPRESPNYVEYVPEVYSLLDTYFETPRGSPDALRLVKLIREKMENVFHQTDEEVPDRMPLYAENLRMERAMGGLESLRNPRGPRSNPANPSGP